MSHDVLYVERPLSPKHGTLPPPPYTAVDTISGPLQVPSSAMPFSPAHGSPSDIENPYHHHSFGPTPISANPTAAYAYYDPRSPYSLTQARIRARQRFIEALILGVVIWYLIGFLLGSEALRILDFLDGWQ